MIDAIVTKIEEYAENCKTKHQVRYHLLYVIYAVFSSQFFISIVSFIIGVLWIPNIIVFNNNFNSYILPTILYIIFFALYYLLTSYKLRWVNHNKLIHVSHSAVSRICNEWIDGLINLIKKEPSDCSHFYQILHKSNRVDFNNKTANFCRVIYDILKEIYLKNNIQVSLMYLYKKDENFNIKMIAFANENSIHPASFETEYDINKDNYYHVSIFKNNISDITVLLNQNEIKNEFKNAYTDSRCSKIKQYIAIPVRSNDNKRTIMLLQIDTQSDYLFGDSKDKIKRDFSKSIGHLVEFLTVWHHNEELIELTKEMHKGGSKCTRKTQQRKSLAPRQG